MALQLSEVFEVDDPKRREFRPPSPLLLLPQQRAPPFSGMAVFPDGSTRFLSLEDDGFKDKYVVLSFYPANFTNLDPTEILAYSDRVKDFLDADCEIVFCSTDSHFAHEQWVGTLETKIQYPILADRTQYIAKAYGVLMGGTGNASRADFIIDPYKRIRRVLINDIRIGRMVSETYRVLRAIRHYDQTGELCGCSWKPEVEKPNEDDFDVDDFFA